MLQLCSFGSAAAGEARRLERDGVSLLCPSGWVEKRPIGAARAVLKISSNAADAANCYLEREPAPAGWNAGAAVDARLARLRERHGPVDVLGRAPRTVAGEPGESLQVAFAFDSLGQPQPVGNLSVHWLHEGQAHALICGAWQHYFPLRLPLFEQVVDSLRHRPPKSAGAGSAAEPADGGCGDGQRPDAASGLIDLIGQ